MMKLSMACAAGDRHETLRLATHGDLGQRDEAQTLVFFGERLS